MNLLGTLLLIAASGGSLLALLLARALRRRDVVEVRPAYRGFLHRLGLSRPEHFLALSGRTISGHPGRNVQRLTLECGDERLSLYFKREDHVGVWVRVLNALEGFGFVSRSLREARVLDALRREGVGCPDWVAAGEDRHGQAFLLLREIEGAVDVRTFLRDHADGPRRRRVARRLGVLLARLHRAGFDHPDLYAKHVLVRLRDDALILLDWQRTRRRPLVGWRRRVRTLAALNATVPDDLVPVRLRIACLRAYLREQEEAVRPDVGRACRSVQRATVRLLRRRHIREKRQFPLPSEAQDWIALDGDALSITSALQRLHTDTSFDWLEFDRQPLGFGQTVTRRWLTLGEGRRTLLVRRRSRRPFAALWAWLTGKSPASPERRTAALLYRLQRHGVQVPRVLAMGQRQAVPWRLDSFLLTEPAADSVPLDVWLRRRTRGRRRVMRDAGALLARLHEAGCYFEAEPAVCPIAVRPSGEGGPQVVLRDVEGVRPQRRLSRTRARGDVAMLQRLLHVAGCKPRAWKNVLAGYEMAPAPAPARVPLPTGPALSPLQRMRQFHMASNLVPLASAAPSPVEESPRRATLQSASVPVIEAPGDSLWRRLFSGVRRILQRSGWGEFVGSNWADRIMEATVTDRFNAKQGRSTGRWVLEAEGDPGGPKRHLTVYLKRHHELPWWLGWLAALWPRGNWSPALKEWEHLEWARRQGVPVPETVAAGEFIGPCGRLQSFLAVRELTGMLALHEAIPLAAQRLDPATFRRWKRGLVAEMARLTRLLHDRWCFHKDLYLCHFYIAADDLDRVPEWRDRVYLIDLHRLARHRWTWWLWQMKDLAQLLYSSEIRGVDVRDRLTFWREYREHGMSTVADRWLRYWILLKWRRYVRHNARRKPEPGS
jgi:heptose I phosphotransferase